MKMKEGLGAMVKDARPLLFHSVNPAQLHQKIF
jgi:hypothetical protein